VATDTHHTIDAVWRIESPRLIAGLARIVRDIGVAEDDEQCTCADPAQPHRATDISPGRKSWVRPEKEFAPRMGATTAHPQFP
jgi:predicted RNA polymerase sigma factor